MTVHDAQSADPWLVRYGDENGAELRLFCFHHAGASASIFQSWQNVIPKGVELTAIQLPGREYRFLDPLMTDMAKIASAIADVLAPHLDKPYVVFGQSMGSLIGINVIRELRTRGFRLPLTLIASGRNAPQFKWIDTGMEKLPDKQFVAAVREYSGTPDALLRDPDMWELWLPRLRADLTISADYEHVEQAPLDCPILVMSAEDDHLCSEPGLAGWRSQTTREVRFVRFPGNHFFLESSKEGVLASVNAELSDLLGRTGGNCDHSELSAPTTVGHV